MAARERPNTRPLLSSERGRPALHFTCVRAGWLASLGLRATWLPIRSVTARLTVEAQQFLVHVKFWGKRVPIGQSNKDDVLGQEIYQPFEQNAQN